MIDDKGLMAVCTLNKLITFLIKKKIYKINGYIFGKSPTLEIDWVLSDFLIKKNLVINCVGILAATKS